jgi:hypothetical protein
VIARRQAKSEPAETKVAVRLASKSLTLGFCRDRSASPYIAGAGFFRLQASAWLIL